MRFDYFLYISQYVFWGPCILYFSSPFWRRHTSTWRIRVWLGGKGHIAHQMHWVITVKTQMIGSSSSALVSVNGPGLRASGLLAGPAWAALFVLVLSHMFVYICKNHYEIANGPGFCAPLQHSNIFGDEWSSCALSSWWQFTLRLAINTRCCFTSSYSACGSWRSVRCSCSL